jgi:RHS repeat-associated protein
VGRVVDPETGYIYLRARYYDPNTAQFLTRDPLTATARSAYAYVDSNPLNRVEPAADGGPPLMGENMVL